MTLNLKMVALNQILDVANRRNFIFTQTHLEEMAEAVLGTPMSLEKYVQIQIDRVALVNEINQLFLQAKDKFLKLNPEGTFYSHQIYENDFIRTEESLRSLTSKISYRGPIRRSTKIKPLKSWLKNIIRKFDLLNNALNRDDTFKSVINRQVRAHNLGYEEGVIKNLSIDGYVYIKLLKGNKRTVGVYPYVKPAEDLK